MICDFDDTARQFNTHNTAVIYQVLQLYILALYDLIGHAIQSTPSTEPILVHCVCEPTSNSASQGKTFQFSSVCKRREGLNAQ